MNKLTLFGLIHLLLATLGCYGLLELLRKTSDEVLYVIAAFVLCYLALWMLSYGLYRQYFHKLWQIFRLFAFFNWEFIKANLRLTYTILSVRMALKPAVVSVPLSLQSNQGITLLANLITLTPGTLSLDVSHDRKFLYVHTLYLEGGTPEGFKQNIKEGFEQRVMAIFP